MHGLQLTQETMKLLMQVKRVLKNDYNINIHLQNEDLANQLASAISSSHDETLYKLACSLWDELERCNRDKNTRTELHQQRESLDFAWQEQNDTLH